MSKLFSSLCTQLIKSALCGGEHFQPFLTKQKHGYFTVSAENQKISFFLPKIPLQKKMLQTLSPNNLVPITFPKPRLNFTNSNRLSSSNHFFSFQFSSNSTNSTLKIIFAVFLFLVFIKIKSSFLCCCSLFSCRASFVIEVAHSRENCRFPDHDYCLFVFCFLCGNCDYCLYVFCFLCGNW